MADSPLSRKKGENVNPHLRTALEARKIVLQEMRSRNWTQEQAAAHLFPKEDSPEAAKYNLWALLAGNFIPEVIERTMKLLGWEQTVAWRKVPTAADVSNKPWRYEDQKTGWRAEEVPGRGVIVRATDGYEFLAGNRANARDMVDAGRWFPFAVHGDGTPVEEDPEEKQVRQTAPLHEYCYRHGWVAIDCEDERGGYLVLCPDGTEHWTDDRTLAIRMTRWGKVLAPSTQPPVRQRVTAAVRCVSWDALLHHAALHDPAYVLVYIETGMNQGFEVVSRITGADAAGVHVVHEETSGYLDEGNSWTITPDQVRAGYVKLLEVAQMDMHVAEESVSALVSGEVS